MQTNLVEFIKLNPQGREADAILRKCVHCGFCLATCPTYDTLGDELDSPRGRIYLMKQVLEGTAATELTQKHLDQCLSCRACETTCPSNVEYQQLLEITRPVVDQQVGRSFKQRILRSAILSILPYRSRFTPLIRAAQMARPMLPRALKAKVPVKSAVSKKSVRPTVHKRKMLLLEGCVQPGIAPNINMATIRVLDRLGITLLRDAKEGCCGAISTHLNQVEDGLDFMRRNIDAWWPHIEQGCEAIVITASGCGAMVKEYGEKLAKDPNYSEKASHISSLSRDLVEVLRDEPVEQLGIRGADSIAFQCPCTLQHAQKLSGSVEALLTRMGFDIKAVANNHLCCGSAGTYSIFQPDLAHQLRSKKLQALEESGAARIVSANIGCITHLSEISEQPVQHWIEVVDEVLANKNNSLSKANN